jgi:hypothetical protein
MSKPVLEAELKQRDTLILDLRDTVEVIFETNPEEKLINILDFGVETTKNATTVTAQTR